MNRKFTFVLLTLCAAAVSMADAVGAPARAPTAALTLEAVNDAGLAQVVGPKAKGAAVLRAQVLLDRARFSPGEIDAAFGSNMQRAIAAFQKANGLNASGAVDGPTWQALNRDGAPILVTYEIADCRRRRPVHADPAGHDGEIQAARARLRIGRRSAGREIPRQPDAAAASSIPARISRRAGEADRGAERRGACAPAKAAKVVVDKSDSTITLVDAAARPSRTFPASTGSEHDPLPVGHLEDQGRREEPGVPLQPEAVLGCRSEAHQGQHPGRARTIPVGVVWIDLSKEHYGIHGTPEPSKIGKTQSHGCIRMTNWDAAALWRRRCRPVRRPSCRR